MLGRYVCEAHTCTHTYTHTSDYSAQLDPELYLTKPVSPSVSHLSVQIQGWDLFYISVLISFSSQLLIKAVLVSDGNVVIRSYTRGTVQMSVYLQHPFPNLLFPLCCDKSARLLRYKGTNCWKITALFLFVSQRILQEDSQAD